MRPALPVGYGDSSRDTRDIDPAQRRDPRKASGSQSFHEGEIESTRTTDSDSQGVASRLRTRRCPILDGCPQPSNIKGPDEAGSRLSSVRFDSS